MGVPGQLAQQKWRSAFGHSRPSQTFLELLKDEVAKEGCALCIEGFINDSGNEGWKLPRTQFFCAFGSGNGEHFRGRRCEPICFVIRALAGALRKTDRRSVF